MGEDGGNKLMDTSEFATDSDREDGFEPCKRKGKKLTAESKKTAKQKAI